jgi:alkanesulfonate monooxygenase SsuD/methylene tetrahydromethanopterin reductase-like flavin-dependent oxidoreductase (luciferase family)
VYSLPPVAIRPVPDTPVPVYIGAGAAAGVRRAARLADGFFSNAPLDTFLEQVTVGREELEKVGRDPASFQWSWYSSLYVSDDLQRGLEELVPHLHARTWKYRDMGESAGRPRGPAVPPAYDATHAERLGRRALIGTGEQIVERLNELEIAAGVPIDFVARSYFPTMSRDQQWEVVGRLAGEVLPHL